MEVEQGNAIIAMYMGYTLYPSVKVPTWFYECENSEWNNLDENDIWVKRATEEFKKYPCVSQMWWEYEKYIEEKQWEDWHYSIWYNKKWDNLIPVVKKLIGDIKDKQKIAGEMSDDMELGKWKSQLGLIEMTLLELEIEPLWQEVVKGIQLITNEKGG